MNKIVLSLFILTNLTVKAQFILAGQHGPKDHFVIADTLIAPNTTYLIDMNGDSITDIQIQTHMYGFSGFEGGACYALPNSNNQVANYSVQYNQCEQGEIIMITPFYLNDTINKNSLWDWAIDDPSLSYYDPDYERGPCAYNAFGSDTAYIGVQVFLGPDTLYGWIEVTAVTDTSLTVVSYACNLGITGIDEHQNNSSIKLYPNPANNQVTIHTSSAHINESAAVSVMNVLGEVMQEEETKWSNEISISIKTLPSGIYFVQLSTDKERWVGRFVKE